MRAARPGHRLREQRQAAALPRQCPDPLGIGQGRAVARVARQPAVQPALLGRRKRAGGQAQRPLAGLPAQASFAAGRLKEYMMGSS